MVSFAPGVTSVNVTIDIDRDAVMESNETVIMTIDSSGVTNAGTTNPTARTYTIENDD
jgi:hypothetical protein